MKKAIEEALKGMHTLIPWLQTEPTEADLRAALTIELARDKPRSGIRERLLGRIHKREKERLLHGKGS